MHPSSFFFLSFQENADTRRDRLRATEGRVPCGSAASVGVKGVASAWGAQRRQSPPPPLASRRLESAADAATTIAAAAAAAAASFNPVVATTQRCVAAKRSAVDAVAPRPPRIYPGPHLLVAETSKEDAMEPETKEEDERHSSTPSPEVAFFFFFFFLGYFPFVCGCRENSLTQREKYILGVFITSYSIDLGSWIHQ